MADALASALISTIVTNLSNQALKDFGILTGLNTELEKLSCTFTIIQAVLYDAEVKQWKSGIEGAAVKTWLRQLKDAAYDADDVLDEFDLNVQRRQQQKGLKNHVRSCFSLHHNPIAFRVEMARKFKSAREKLDAIYEMSGPLGLRKDVGSTSSLQGVLEWRLTDSLVDDSEICGRDDQKAELINDLVSSSEALSVHALCGIGGLGKTTLAQLVYNAETIKTHFDLRMWVCVSDDTDIRRLTRAIIESIGDNTSSNEQELDPLKRRLLEKLAGKKFLLVLDDVWEDFPDKWDRSKNAIRSDATGSVVLITTRIPQVAEKMATVPIRQMGRLSDDDSWSLFALHAFSKGKAEEHEHFKTFRERIVKKCGGVPLVLKVLGSLMQEKQEEKEWLDIMESELWDLGDEGKKILAILRLSYTHLPMNLRQCFSYCCIYPKDYVMKKAELIQIWMANGFISCGGRKDLHETGNEIFRELVARSFFQNVETGYFKNSIFKWDGTTCKMHDLLHDVATSVMEHELHLIQPDESLDGAKNCRHVSCSTLFKGNSKFPSLRSYFFFMTTYQRPMIHGKEDVEWLSSQKHLRILRLPRLYFQKFPMSLSKHLRYLDVSGSRIKRLPESTSSLHKLQTLNLRDCERLKQLPKGMKEMKSLVYLDIRGCNRLKGMPPGMGQLKGMRKLSKFIVGKKDGCKIGELKELNGLEGELSISGLCNVKSVADFKSANLMEKKMLTSLELRSAIGFEENSCIDVEALSVLQPHQNLRELYIRGYGSLELPDWMMDLHMHLPNLVEIKLTKFSQCQQLPIPLDRLDSLKLLELNGMSCLEHIGVEVYGDGETAAFPSLLELRLFGMRSLKEWAEITTSASSSRAAFPFPCLRVLSISECPLLTKFPIIPSVQDLSIRESPATTSQLTVLIQANFIGLKSLSLQLCAQLESLPELGLQHNVCSLESLRIYGCDKLQSLPSTGLWCSSSLRHLEIRRCPELITLSDDGLRHLTALQDLCLDHCPKMTSLPESIQHLTALQTLKIVDCKELSCLPDGVFRHLTALQELTLGNCPKMTSLPESIQHLTALQTLKIVDCKELSCLPDGVFRHLTALQELTLGNCPKMTSLPESIQHLTALQTLMIGQCEGLSCLPDGIGSLTTLVTLVIFGCPDLGRRCEKDKGEDWSKIAHIPNIRIDRKQIQPGE